VPGVGSLSKIERLDVLLRAREGAVGGWGPGTGCQGARAGELIPAGANQSDAPRAGLVDTHCLGWLRAAENRFQLERSRRDKDQPPLAMSYLALGCQCAFSS